MRMRIVLTIGCMATCLALNGCASTTRAASASAAKVTENSQPGLVRIPVRQNGLVGTLVVPDTRRAYPGVLRIGGGEGGVSLGDAETIAAEGFAVFAVAYFGIEGLPADLQEVPLEYFGEAIAWMKGSPNVASSRLGIIGISRGSSLSLLLPTIYDEFDAVVAIAPSHVTWQSHYLDWDRYADRSSHTLHGKPIPYVPYDFSNKEAMVGCDETAACVRMYEYSLQQTDRVAQATVPVERIKAPVLLFSGRADSMWPSSTMGELIMQRLNSRGSAYEQRHVAYADAGHCGLNRCYDHLPHEGDKAAVKDMRAQLIAFLKRNLR